MKLVIEDEAGTRSIVPFTGDEIVVGRAAEDVTFKLGDRNVSRRHARFVRQNGVTWVEDLGSLTGTRVNGERIGGRRKLRQGDLVQIGDYDLALVDEVAAAALGEAPPLPPQPRHQPQPAPMPPGITLQLEPITDAPEPASAPAPAPMPPGITLQLEPITDAPEPAPALAPAPAPVPAAARATPRRRTFRVALAAGVVALVLGVAAGWAVGIATAPEPPRVNHP